MKVRSSLVSTMREIIARIYRTGSVNVSVNGLSHMARSSMEIVSGSSVAEDLSATIMVAVLS